MEPNPYSYAFFGTPTVGVWVLDEMAAAGLMPKVIVTAPDRPAGRGMRMTPSPVKVWAEEHSIPVLQPEKLGREFRATLASYGAEVFLIAAYGKILRPTVLTLAPHGCLNVHPSLLPKYRGASPIESQILADERKVGVSLMVLDEEMDHGPLLAQERIEVSGWPIGRAALSELLARAGGRLAAQHLGAWVAGTTNASAQDHAVATYTRKIEKEDGLLDLAAPGRLNYLKYCAYEGWPGTYFYAERAGAKIRIKITKASLAGETFVIERVVPEGKNEIGFAQFSAQAAV
jgi:methionyl-tRNA formyltransferase